MLVFLKNAPTRVRLESFRLAQIGPVCFSAFRRIDRNLSILNFRPSNPIRSWAYKIFPEDSNFIYKAINSMRGKVITIPKPDTTRSMLLLIIKFHP